MSFWVRFVMASIGVVGFIYNIQVFEVLPDMSGGNCFCSAIYLQDFLSHLRQLWMVFLDIHLKCRPLKKYLSCTV